MIRPELAPEELVEHARRAEAAGFKEVWLWEDCFWGGGIAASATVLAATEHVIVGLGIMPAPVRNAAFAAMEAAALARLHPGRFHVGLGHGVGEWMRQIGAKPASQLTLLEEVVEAVRALLARSDGLGRGSLRPPARREARSSAARGAAGVGRCPGPKGLELSGRVADGTVLDSHSSTSYVRWAREHIEAGRAAAGRHDPHRVTVFAYCATDAAGEAIVQAKVDELRAEGGVRADFLPADAPLSEFALIGDARRESTGAHGARAGGRRLRRARAAGRLDTPLADLVERRL